MHGWQDQAARQHGIITRAQLHKHGCTAANVRALLSGRQLERCHRGIYRVVGAPQSWVQEMVAGCFSTGGFASHLASAQAWRLSGLPRGFLDISVVGSRRRGTPGVPVHQRRGVLASDIVVHDSGLRVASVPLTLLDCAPLVPRPLLEQAYHDARSRGLVTSARLEGVLARLGGFGRRGTAMLRELLADERGKPAMASSLEVKLARALVAGGLPEPVRQLPLRLPDGRTVRVDLAYPDARLAIEVGHEVFHDGALRARSDRRRDNQLALVEWECRRFDNDDVERHLDAAVAVIAAVYARRRRASAS